VPGLVTTFAPYEIAIDLCVLINLDWMFREVRAFPKQSLSRHAWI
jgi:hypothetical protein